MNLSFSLLYPSPSPFNRSEIQRLGLFPMTKQTKEKFAAAYKARLYSSWWRKILRVPKNKQSAWIKALEECCHADIALKKVNLNTCHHCDFDFILAYNYNHWSISCQYSGPYSQFGPYTSPGYILYIGPAPNPDLWTLLKLQ